MKTSIKIRFGFTLIELMITLLIALFVFAGIGVAMVDSIKGFGKMYERTEGNYQRQDITAGVIPDSYVARATFESVCRKAYIYRDDIDITNQAWVKLYYYSSPTAVSLDSSALFNFVNNQLTVSYGDGAGNSSGNAIILAKNVTACKFDIQGSSVIMTITIDNTNVNDTAIKQRMKMTVTCAAERHNG